MSYLERAITDGHAKLTGDGKQQAVPAPNGGRAQAPDRTPSDRADLVVFRDDERKKPYAVIECKADGVTDAEFNQAVEQAGGNGTVAQASAPAGCGSVPLPVHGRATTRGGTPLEPAAGTAALRSNDIQPVSKEALIGAIKKCHQTLWAGCKLSPPAAFGEISNINQLQSLLYAA